MLNLHLTVLPALAPPPPPAAAPALDAYCWPTAAISGSLVLVSSPCCCLEACLRGIVRHDGPTARWLQVLREQRAGVYHTQEAQHTD